MKRYLNNFHPSHFSEWRVIAGVGAMLLLGGMGQAQTPGIRVTINGQPVQFQDIGPQQIDGRTLVPVRGVLEKLGANIAFNAQTQTVVASTPNIDIQLVIGSKTAVVNAKEVTLDTPAQTIHDHTFVPLRFIGEALGADIAWDSASRTVRILTKDALNASNGSLPVAVPHPPRQDRPDRNNGVAPIINSFTQNAGKWLRAGEKLQAVLEGTPGGQAAFRLPGLVEDVPMRETAAGHYVGEWRVPLDRPLQLKAAAVIGSLRLGGKSAPLIQAGGTVSVDALPPRVRDAAPENTNVSDPRPNISAAFDDQGSGIDRNAVHLLVNGLDVTREATVTRDFISYRPNGPLVAGTQQIELRVADVAGNQTVSRWTFIEQSHAAGGIRSVSDNANRVLQPGDVLHVELSGSPGGRVWFGAGSIQNVPLREDQPGHYVADYTIRKGDDIAAKPLAFYLRTPVGETFEQASRNAVRVSTGRPNAPVITSPGPNQPPSNPLVIRGKATPNCAVHVKVDYRNKVIGPVALQGTAADTTVIADHNGNWETGPISIGGILGNRGVEYTISASALNAAQEQSDTTTTRFRIQ